MEGKAAWLAEGDNQAVYDLAMGILKKVNARQDEVDDGLNALNGNEEAKLAAAKEAARTELDQALAAFDRQKYTDGEWTQLEAIRAAANSAIAAAQTPNAAAEALAEAKQSLLRVPATLGPVKQTAQSDLENVLATYDRQKYTDAEWTQLEAAFEAGREAVAAARTPEAVAAALSAVKANLAKVPATKGVEGKDKDGGTEKVLLTAAKITIKDRIWTGKALKPVLSATLGGKKLTAGKDYTLSWGANVNIGRGRVTITGKGTYVGSKTAYFQIIPKNVSGLKAGKPVKGKVKLTWKKASKAQKITKYQIRYRLKGAKKWSTRTLSAASGSLTLKNLKKNRVYQFQILAYKMGSGKKYAGAWSGSAYSKTIR